MTKTKHTSWTELPVFFLITNLEDAYFILFTWVNL